MREDQARHRSPRTSPHVAVAACAAILAAIFGGGASGVNAVPDAAAQPPSLRRPDPVKELAAGKLLVSARGLPDPNFADTVILVLEYDGEHALGVIVNRPTGVPLARLFPQLKVGDGTSPVYFGGPVEVEGALALTRATKAPADARRVFGDVYLINTRARLEDAIRSESGPDRLRVYLGYSGWGKGQLEMETSRGAWYVFPADAGAVFDPEPDSLWPREIRRAEERVLLAFGPRSLPAQPDARVPSPVRIVQISK